MRAEGEVSRGGRADVAVVAAALVVLVSLFLPWFDAAATSKFLRLTVTGSFSGLYNSYAYMCVALNSLVVLYVVGRALLHPFPVQFPVTHEQLLATVGVINLGVVVVDFVDRPDSLFGWDYGAYIGIGASALVVAVTIVPGWLRSVRLKSAATPRSA
jgi:hypothetical protein